MNHQEIPTREQQLELVANPEARAERRVWRTEALTTPHGILAGRRRTVLEAEKTLALSMPAAEVGIETVRALASMLDGDHPLFDKFTRHYRVKPDAVSVENFINGGSNRKGIDGQNIGPKPIASFPFEERKKELKARQRQAMYIADRLQRVTFEDRNTARLRRFSLMATQYFIRQESTLDNNAAQWSADAIVDFGHVLNDEGNSRIIEPLRNADIGFQIIRIGTLAADDSDLLKVNQPLLSLVQIEQHARDDYWTKIYDFTNQYFPSSRLTQTDRDDGHRTQEELERLAQISPAVAANLPPQPVDDYAA